MLGYLGVSIINPSNSNKGDTDYRILNLHYVIFSAFALVHASTIEYSLLWKTFVVCTESDSGEIKLSTGATVPHPSVTALDRVGGVTLSVTHLPGDHTWLCSRSNTVIHSPGDCTQSCQSPIHQVTALNCVAGVTLSVTHPPGDRTQYVAVATLSHLSVGDRTQSCGRSNTVSHPSTWWPHSTVRQK